MADNNQAASLPVPAAVPVPVEDDEVAKEVKELRRPLLPVEIKAPVAVMPANNNKTTTTTPVVPGPCIHMVVFRWAALNAVFFSGTGIATVLNLTEPSCTKSTWIFSCVTLTDEVATDLGKKLNTDHCGSCCACGELLCIMVAELALVLLLLLQKLLTGRTTTTTSRRWPAIVHALSWVALAATVGTHCMKVAASNRIVHAADPRHTLHVVAFVGYVCLALDLLAGIILCCSPRRRLELWASICRAAHGDDGKV